ncbi:MAG: hypothetical protein JXO72_14020 [Vicinamibacteria bacterium]|nr:hypothetical protein [Vicinamibacteria bacterium]
MLKDTKALRQELDQLSTDELVSILRNRDEDEWRPEVFDVVALILKDHGVSLEEVNAMGPEGFDVMEYEPTIAIGKFFSPTEAHAARMALEQADIPAWVAEQAGGTIYGIAIGARLQVRVKDVNKACETIAAPVSSDSLPAELSEPPCPACGSRNVTSEAWIDEYDDDPMHWRKTRRKWHHVCDDCNEAWPARE